MASGAVQSDRGIRRWLVEYPRAIPAAIFLLVAAITALSVFAIEQGEAKRDRAELRDRAHTVAAALERRANSSAAYLRAGAAMFASVDTVDAPLFDRFVSELQDDFEARGIVGIGWARSLAPGEISGFQQGMSAKRSDAFGGLSTSQTSRDRVVSVTFLRPAGAPTSQALGYDLYLEANGRAAMDEATRSVRPTASGLVALEQENGATAPGFLIYMPVFRTESGQRELQGFVYSPFNAANFLKSALEVADRTDLGIRLYDQRTGARQLLAAIEPDRAAGMAVTEPITIADRPMVLEVESARSGSLSLLSAATLIFGLLVASLLMVVARLVTQQVREDQDTLKWLAEQHSIRDSLTRELNHRVKNTLANVLSIMALTRRRSGSLDEFADGLDGRIRALSATHDLLTQSEWGMTPIRSVVEAELAPYARVQAQAIKLAGPAVELAPNDALMLGMAVHELASNASKYGALSAPEGRVSVEWRMEGGDRARLDWCEAGGPAIAKERKRGFGMDLIEKIVAQELENPVELTFMPNGVHCRLWIPVRRPSEFAIRAAQLNR